MDIELKKLAIITTHPIQYNAPFFELLSKRKNINLKVFYTWEQSQEKIFDPDFGHVREWDIPLLQGYEYEFVKNTATNPGSSHFKGIVNPDIVKQIDAFAPDAILIYGWAFSGHLKAIRHYKGKIPVFFRGDSTLIDEPAGFNFKKLLRRIFLRWVYSFIDVAFYTGIKNKQYYLKHGLKEKQLVFAPHCVDNKRFFANEEILSHSKTLKVQLNISDEEIVFLFAGKFHPKKDPVTLIKAFLKTGLKNAHLIMVGNGILEHELKTLSENHIKIHFLPFQNQSKMPAIYHLCNVFILPSAGPGETWGLALNEAMAAGKALIASNKTGGAIDLISEGENGYIFNAGNVDELAGKMVDIVTQTQAFGKHSYIKVQHWSYDKFAQAVELKLSK